MKGIRDQVLVALDCETTGLKPASGDRVIEIGLVRGRRGETPECWSSLIQPERSVRCTEVHGITSTMLEGQPSFGDCVPTLERYLEGAVLVAHHAKVDLAFLAMEYRRLNLPWADRAALDTLGLARGLASLSGRSLAALSEEFALPVQPSHRAQNDAMATWYLAWELMDRLDPEGSWTVEDAIRHGQRSRAHQREILVRRLQQAIQRGEELWVEYRSAEALTIRRITLRKVGNREVEAWCHLRGADRKFRLDRLRVLEAP